MINGRKRFALDLTSRDNSISASNIAVVQLAVVLDHDAVADDAVLHRAAAGRKIHSTNK
jgi:hypothetical protein